MSEQSEQPELLACEDCGKVTTLAELARLGHGDQCIHCGGGLSPVDEPATTFLEAAVAAHCAALIAWVNPDDHEVRADVVVLCAAVGMDYIETVAAVMTVQECLAGIARKAVADGLGASVDKLVQLGQRPRGEDQ